VRMVDTTSGTEAPDTGGSQLSTRGERVGMGGGLRALIAPRPRRRAIREGGGANSTDETINPKRSGLDLKNSWQILAAVLTPVGVLLILMAWYGAAHAGYVQEQIPYLVSGSFIGLGCMVLGGLLYWAHWLYRIYDQADQHQEEQLKQADRHHVEHLEALERMTRSISDRLEAGDSGFVASESGRVTLTGSASTYVATESGTAYHLPTCPVVSHHSDGLRSLSPAEIAGMDACRICLSTKPL
jgi:hypothetical protein